MQILIILPYSSFENLFKSNSDCFYYWFLIYYEPNTIIILLILSSCLFVSYQFFFKNRFKLIGKENIIYNNILIRYANEISKGLTELNIYNKSNFYLKKFQKLDLFLHLQKPKLDFLGFYQKFFRSINNIFLFVLSFYYYYNDNIDKLLLNLGIFVCSLRVVPAFLEIIHSLNALSFLKNLLMIFMTY